MRLRGAERVCWTKRSEESANGEGVASGSATEIFIIGANLDK